MLWIIQLVLLAVAIVGSIDSILRSYLPNVFSNKLAIAWRSWMIWQTLPPTTGEGITDIIMNLLRGGIFEKPSYSFYWPYSVIITVKHFKLNSFSS